jgi:hypothetical protein
MKHKNWFYGMGIMLLCLCFSLGCAEEEDKKQCTCGNGVVEEVENVCKEECDGTDLGGKTCKHFEEYTGGVLSCKDDCTFDFSQCIKEETGPECGNNEIEEGEVCDGTALPEDKDTCEEYDPDQYRGGTLTCNDDCNGFNTDACTPIGCNDGFLDEGEDCDTKEGATIWAEDKNECSDFGFEFGDVTCTDQCKVDISACHNCGNNEVDEGEECDGTDLAGQTCISKGFEYGELKCYDPGTENQCKFDTSGCKKCCGDNQLQGPPECANEECEGDEFATDKDSCEDFGFEFGSVTCTDQCEVDISACHNCGNDKVDEGEECDGADLNNKTCEDLNFDYGTLACYAPETENQCKFDLSGCKDCCGDGTIDYPDGHTCQDEPCDGDIFPAGRTCETETNGVLPQGELTCEDCSSVNTEGCYNCGNGTIEGPEECDGTNFGGKTCETEEGPGWTGDLACTTDTCQIDTSGCIPPAICENPVTDQKMCGDDKCGLFTKGETKEIKCVPQGTQQDGGACEPREYEDGQIDDCYGANVCTGYQIEEFTFLQCTPFCRSDDDCPNAARGRRCWENVFSSNVGLCGWCDVLDQSLCPETNACTMLRLRTEGETATQFWLAGCVPAGDRGAGDACNSPIGQCAKGLGCLQIGGTSSLMCYKYCNLEGGEPSCPEGYNCSEVRNWPAAVGICTPAS